MTSIEPLVFPTDADDWVAFASGRPAAAVALVADVDARLIDAADEMDAATRLDLWNDADLALLEPNLVKLGSNATLRVVDGADHSFKVPASSGRKPADVIAGLAGDVAAWIARLAPD